MTDFLEARGRDGFELFALEGDRLTIGKASENDVALAQDSTVSRMHAVLERFPAGWSIRDLGSRNGTYVNGDRLMSERALRPGDEIRVGETLLVYRAETSADPIPSATVGVQGAPELTRREREVLLALCRPVLSGSLLTEPASVRQIAEDLVVTESAVKKHLANLYDKFALHADGARRRGRLAGEAIRRGAVSLADIR